MRANKHGNFPSLTKKIRNLYFGSFSVPWSAFKMPHLVSMQWTHKLNYGIQCFSKYAVELWIYSSNILDAAKESLIHIFCAAFFSSKTIYSLLMECRQRKCHICPNKDIDTNKQRKKNRIFKWDRLKPFQACSWTLPTVHKLCIDFNSIIWIFPKT